MRILHRHLLRELLWNALLFLAVILAVYFVMLLALRLGSRYSGIPSWVAFRAVGYEVISNLHLILPLGVLSSAIFTYGRSSAEGEFTAARVAGVHPYHVLVPALFFGSVTTLGLAWLQDEVIPGSHHMGDTNLKRETLENLDNVLRGYNRGISENRWVAKWNGLAQDEEGRTFLLGLTVLEKNEDDSVRSVTHAERTHVSYLSPPEDSLLLRFQDVKRYENDRLVLSGGTFDLALGLDKISSADFSDKGCRDRTYEELLTRWRQKHAEALAVGPGSPRHKKLLEEARENRASYHARVAFAFSGVLFALLGACLGLVRAVGNRALVFLVGFLLVAVVYYPAEELGKRMAEAGHLHPFPALWGGNALLLVISVVLLRKVLRV